MTIRPLLQYDIRCVYELPTDLRSSLVVWPNGTLAVRPTDESEATLTDQVPESWIQNIESSLEHLALLGVDKNTDVDPVEGVAFPVETTYRIQSENEKTELDLMRHQFLDPDKRKEFDQLAGKLDRLLDIVNFGSFERAKSHLEFLQVQIAPKLNLSEANARTLVTMSLENSSSLEPTEIQWLIWNTKCPTSRWRLENVFDVTLSETSESHFEWESA